MTNLRSFDSRDKTNVRHQTQSIRIKVLWLSLWQLSSLPGDLRTAQGRSTTPPSKIFRTERTRSKSALKTPRHRTVGSCEDELERQCLVSDMSSTSFDMTVDRDQRQLPVMVAISNGFEMGGYDGLEPD